MKTHCLALVAALTAIGASAQTINIQQSELIPLGDPGMISWNAADAGLEGTVTFKLIAEVTGTAVANGFLLDVQKNGYPAPPIGGATDDIVVFAPEAVPGDVATLEVPAGCNLAIFHDVFDETGGFLTGPNGILDDVGVNARDAYLNSDSTLNYSVVGRRQLIKYYPVNPSHNYSFTSQWGTKSNLGSGYRLLLFLDDDHSPNYDYDDMIIGVLAPPCESDDDCDDSDACNGEEFCDAGVCKPGQAVVCDDGDNCNGVESCLNGSCVVGAPLDCDDGVECTNDSCDNSVCVNLPINDHCHDDGEFCNGSEICDPQLGCVSTGSPCPPTKVCDEDANACRDCESQSDCDDADPCTVGHACIEGDCQPGSPVDCSILSTTCEQAACNPLGVPGNCDSLIPQPNGTTCSDGDPCTMADACQNGECVSGESVDCEQLAGPCETLACDPLGTEGNCDVITYAPDNTPCNNEAACVDDAVCQAGVCVGDLDFDLGQWTTFADCMAGPDQSLADGCECADTDSNGSVDLFDLFHVQVLFIAP